MGKSGVMQEIRDRLASGESAKALIQQGYKSGSVFKTQWQMRRKAKLDGKVPPAALMQRESMPFPNRLAASGQGDGAESIAALKAESGELHSEVARLRQEAEHADTLQAALKDTQDRLANAEAEAKELQVLRQRVAALEPEARAAEPLRQRVRELEGQLQEASHTQAAMRQGAAQWQHKVEAEQAARQKAEQRTEEYRRKGTQVWQENQSLQQQVASMNQAVQMLYAQLQELQPLRVWVGHPCVVCGKPMSGLVDRKTAARLMKDFGHKDCLNKQNSGLGKLLLAGGALYGLSRLR